MIRQLLVLTAVFVLIFKVITMKYRQIGSTDIKASVITLGTWVMGGWMWGGCDDEASFRTIRTAIDSGITTIDTAPIYGFGRSEETVGKAIRGINRDSIVIASKCGISWSLQPLPENCGEWHCFADDDGRTETLEKYAVYRWLRPDVVRQGVEDSLRRLGTDYIDLMQVHHVSDRTTAISETMGVLEDMRQEGKIRAIGISNSTVSQFDEYCEFGSLDSDQERYSMLDRTVEKNGVLQRCRDKNVTFLAYSPLENGLLTGKLDPERAFRHGDLRAGDPKFSKENIARVNKALAVISDIAKRYELSVAQFAAAWVASRYEKAIVLCGARTPEQVLDNAAAGDAQLSVDDFEDVDAILRDFNLLKD